MRYTLPYRFPKDGAGNGIRTRDFQLGKLTLYQLSYARTSYNPVSANILAI